MTGEVSILFPGADLPQRLEVAGWFDLAVEEGDGGYRIFKRDATGP